jgi:P-loop containing NTP hydrolase pore-1
MWRRWVSPGLAAECWVPHRRTYSTLISVVKGRSRLQQVVDWVGGPDNFDGCIFFDEVGQTPQGLFP